jgi:hypothetical protein
MELYHSFVRVGEKGARREVFNPLAISTLVAYRKHLEMVMPHVKDKVEVGFIEGTNVSEICFSHSLGWDSEDWNKISYVVIALPIALENCKKSGIQKIVLFCNNELMNYTIDEIINA